MKLGSKRALRLCAILVALLVVAAIGLVTFAAPAEPADGPVCYRHGDVNSDGTVDSRDAIYTLYNVLLGKEEYPVEQSLDFNGDTNMDSRDAIYVLYAYMNEDDPTYEDKLEGLVHNYYDPTWQWEESNAVVTFKCGCGETSTFTVAEGVAVSEGESKAATCVDAGFRTYVAKITVDGQEYTDTKVVTLPAGTGHSMVGTQDCENGSYCLLCDYVLEPLGHQWALAADLSTAATCTVKGVQGYRCTVCQQTRTVEQEGTVSHQYAYLEGQDIDKGGCLFVKQYQCSVCRDVIEGTAASDSYSIHSYKATLTKEATCKVQGEKTYTCTNGCGHSYTEPVATNDSHAWDAGVQGNGVMTYTCTDCAQTKTAVSVTSDAAVSKDALSDAQELQLDNDTALTMDESVVENLDADRQIKISVEAMDLEEVETKKELSAEEKAQIGDNKVYDFSMVYADNNDKVDFQGEITVSLPYTLQPGEDIDSIDVWYISDAGELERVDGTYSNGFVTFTTDHFSYYTVTRLTPAQRCERYGHIPVETKKQASCTEDGYTMSVCQRCAAELEKEVYKMSGHSYQTNVTAATCDTDGQCVQTCQTCGHTVTETLPALGHALEVDAAQAVKASCAAAGKEVYVCTRKDCAYQREDAQPQLEHQFKDFEEKAADCTSKGYKTQKCQLCEEVVTISEEAPLGHEYLDNSVAWSWSEDHYSASAVLVCSHDKSHTKTLNAVVTETVVSSTCEGDGAVTYRAEASHNNKSFVDEVVITEDAPGHKPGTQWESKDDGHYHVCGVCQKKVDFAAHNWNSGTVTKQPTCTEAGTKLVKCTVCDYSKEQKIPATGEHTYVNGVCSVCGYEEGSCEHLILTRKELDVSSFNICGNSKFWEISCDCGQVKRYGYEGLSCTMGEEKYVTVTAPNGQTVEGYVITCTKCGLTCTESSYAYGQEDPCMGTYYHWVKMTMDGKLVIDASFEMGEPREHFAYKPVGKLDLTTEEYGLCGEKLVLVECACGQNQAYDVQESCEWRWDGTYEGNGSRYICSSCGAIRTGSYTEKPGEGCSLQNVYTCTYEKDGKTVFTYTEVYSYYNHEYELSSYEMLGTSCEDGVIVQKVCANCGERSKYFRDWHEEFLTKTFDFADDDICYSGVIQRSCPCEEAYTDFAYVHGEKSCSWTHTGQDAQTGTDTFACTNCGATRTEVTSIGEKGEHCLCEQRTTVKLADKNGNVLATVYRYYDTERHNMKQSAELQGESCADGVKIISACTDCDYSYSYTSTYHETMDKETYDLSQYGLCGGTAVLRGCACGESTWINWNNSACSWTFIRGEENAEIHECENCGVRRVYSWDRQVSENPCKGDTIHTYTFTKDGQELLRIGYTGHWESHTDVYELTLKPGAVSCEDGYTVNATCVVCGETSSWENSGHSSYRVEYEPLGEGILCGPIIRVVEACACGQYYNAYTDWSDNNCDFNDVYDEETDSWVYICSTCGVSRSVEREEKPIEGETCLVEGTERYIFSKDGKELFSYDRNYTASSHLWTASFRLIGDTCDEGYYLINVCQKCGETNEYSEPRYGCRNYSLELTEVYNDDQICGPVYLEKRGCACGARVSYQCTDSCSFEEYGYDNQLDQWMYQCTRCGVLQTNRWDYDRVENSCVKNVTVRYWYYRDRQLLVEIQEEFSQRNHELLYSYSLHGDSCEDGYDVTYRCRYCDYTGSNTNNTNHNTYTTEYYDLAEYGLCDGYVDRRNCACGYYSYSNWELGCNWSNTGKTDPATGATEYYCAKCDTYWYYSSTQRYDAEQCRMIGTLYFKWVRDGQTILEISISKSSESHEYVIDNVVFDVADGDCEGGYTVYLKCKNCDKSYREWNNGHSYYLTDTVYLSELGGCGGTITMSVCPCGKYGDIDRDWSCSMDSEFTSSGDDFNGTEMRTWTCEDCGIQYSEEISWTIPEGECVGTMTVKGVLRAGDEVRELSYTDVYENHYYLMTNSSLDDPTLGCEGGYNAVLQCERCNRTETRSGSGHGSYPVKRVNLDELGACGGEIYERQCSCGKYSDVSYDWDCDMEHLGTEGEGNELSGWSEEREQCTKCGMLFTIYSESNRSADSCFGTAVYTYTVALGDRVETLQKSDELENHNYLMTDVVLHDPAAGCEGGYVITNTCNRCGASYTNEGSNHNTYTVDRVSLYTLGACGGEIYKTQCPCGEYAYVETNWECSTDYDQEYTGDDREGAETVTYNCEECGMKFVRESAWSIPENQCIGKLNGTATVTVGDQSYTFTYSRNKEDHNWRTEYVLEPDSQTCLDGVEVHYYCKDCESTQNGYTSWHGQGLVESIDLTQYGSVCGGSLERYACACGEYQHYTISEDTLCDLDGSYSVPVWIEGALEDGQYTSDGWNSTYSYANMLICAVTDPQCGLKIRNAVYWLQEGCQAVQYETWQLGYDAATGTCLREITVPTGEKHDYHSYVQTAIDETSEEGHKVTGNLYTCPDCGSTYCEKQYYSGNDRVKWEREAVNTLDNGENKRWLSRYEYLYAETANGKYSFTTLDRTEYVYANGENYWYQYAYDYNFQDSCKRTETYSNSNGYYDVTEDTCHRYSSDFVYLTEPTCSQHGVRQWTETCYLCGQVVSVYNEELEPNDHSFYWDYSKETYACYNCDLENSNGSSGAIIMEDLSTDADYVVGYCNCNGVEFRPYVSVILYDVAEGENDELVLDFNNARFLTVEEDGICAVAYNAEKVDMYTAMAIAEAGYTGSYAVRISFVPVNGESTLDYAITFDTQSAQ